MSCHSRNLRMQPSLSPAMLQGNSSLRQIVRTGEGEVRQRSFFSILAALLAIPAFGQKTAVMQKGQAVVCDGDAIKCPNGHDSCRTINAPLMVGNDNRSYPDSAQLFDYHLMRCDQCHVLFTRE